jgi:hypothetical protein
MPSSRSLQLELEVSDELTNNFKVLKECGSLLTYAPHILAYNGVIGNTTQNYYECHVTTLIDFYVTAQEVGIAWAV